MTGTYPRPSGQDEKGTHGALLPIPMASLAPTAVYRTTFGDGEGPGPPLSSSLFLLQEASDASISSAATSATHLSRVPACAHRCLRANRLRSVMCILTCSSRGPGMQVLRPGLSFWKF